MGTEDGDKQRMDSFDSSTSSIPAEDAFTWLRQYARGPAYVSYSEFSNHSACSFDFGQEGFAASCNYGGELLQMTSPSEQYGILFARGDFEYSLYLSLARAQREHGGKSSFGLKVASSSDFAINTTGPIFSLGPMVERGCYNYRWPFTEYSLQADRPTTKDASTVNINLRDPMLLGNCHTATGKRDTVDVGVCSRLSFVRGGVLYQVLRLDRQCHPGVTACQEAPTGTELILTIDGPMRFQSFLSLNQRNAEDPENGTKDVVFTDGQLKNEGKLACFSGKLEATREIRWEATLSEFNIALGIYEEIVLDEFDVKQDHCTQDSSKSLPVYKATLKSTTLDDSRIFIASFRLYETTGAAGTSGALVAARNLDDLDIPKIIGIGPRDELATGAMWQSIFLERQEGIESISESYEANLVARCLEKILAVDLVPAAWPARRPMALVSNTFLKANIDLKSVFWKTRFLIKIDLLLTRTIKASSLDTDGFQSPEDYDQTLPLPERKRGSALESSQHNQITTTIATIHRIRRAIGDIMAYLVGALLGPSTGKSILMPEDSVPGESNYYYVMVTIWYVVRHYPSVKWDWQDDMKKNGMEWGRGVLGSSSRLPSRRLNPLPSDRSAQAITKDKDSLLKWFHHESILCLQAKAEQGIPLIPPGWTTTIEKVQRTRSTAKIALAKRISSAQPYRAEDEIVDRLAFLAEELWPELSDAKIVAKRVAKRIQSREFTRTINPCQLLPGEEGYTGGPWEIHALCHHSRLVIACRKMCHTHGTTEREENAEEVEHFRKKFCPFLTSEVSLTPCWERSNSAARRGFLRSEATAVLGSTILDIFQNDLDYIDHIQGSVHDSDISDESENKCNRHISGKQPHRLNSHSAGSSKASRKVYFRGAVSRLRFTGEPATVEDLLALQLDTLEQLASARGLEPHIDYLRFQPPRRYHPEEFFNSLDDTPQMYRKAAIEKIRVPEGIRRALSEGAFQDEDIVKLTGDQKQKLDSLAIIDIKTPDPLPASKPIPVYSGVEELNDSLIDQEVRHRLLVARTARCLPVELLRLFVYVLHPEMMDGFNNHTMRVSRFVLQKRTSVVAYITLRSWQLGTAVFRPSSSMNSTGSAIPRSMVEEETISLPGSLEKAFKNREAGDPKDTPPSMELKVSSICISTNDFGDFSKCSVITDLIQKHELGPLGAKLQEIWDQFIHQPQTGRFLVFSVILGLVCREISRQYHDAIRDFVDKFKFDNLSASYLRDSAWLQGPDAEAQLQLSLWSLEALYKLSNTMAVTVRTVEQAKAELHKEIEHGPGKRSEELQKICLENLETLEISLAELTAVQIKLERRVELNSRYSTALSTVLALRDSRASFRQNNTIQKLTYITIGCLPVGLSAALFAVPQDQNVLKEDMGLGWFIGIVVILSAVIFAIAGTIDSILRLHPSHILGNRYFQKVWRLLRGFGLVFCNIFTRLDKPPDSGGGGGGEGVGSGSSTNRYEDADEKGSRLNGKSDGSDVVGSMV